MNTPNRERCNICDGPLDMGDIHPDSLPIPDGGIRGENYTAMHMGCANGEDANSGQVAEDVDLGDTRTWIRLI